MADSAKGRGKRLRVPIPMRDLNRLRLRQNVQQFFIGAGLRVTKDGEEGVFIRSDSRPPTLLIANELVDAAGKPLPNTRHLLDPDAFPNDGSATDLAALQTAYGLRPSGWLMQFQFDLFAANDPFQELVALAREHNLALWTIRTTELFRRRLQIFEIFEYLRSGNDPSRFVERPRVQVPLVSGLVELQPASTVCSVLAARNQPLVAVLLTPALSQVVLVPRHGAFTREATVAPWPIGFGRISMTGARRGAYATPLKTLSPGHGESALQAVVKGASTLFDGLTNPDAWSDNGNFDLDARLIQWGSIRFGLDAINGLASDWSSTDAIWTAFRGLTTLQGIWDCELSDLLQPDRVRDYAVAKSFSDDERSFAGGLVENYRASLLAAFPGLSAATAATRLAQLRNLIHGMRAESRDPTTRLAVLRAVETAGPSLELIRDIATMWWMALILSPTTYATPGKAPWHRRPADSA